MSEFEDQEHFDDFPEMEKQDFSPLEIDEEIALQLALDIAPNNPERYENAKLWAELILESTRHLGIAPEADVHQLDSYLWGALVDVMPEGMEDAAEVNKEFIGFLTDNAITEYGYYHPPEGDEFTSISYRKWEYSDDVVADYVGNKMEYDDLGRSARKLIRDVKDRIVEMDGGELSEIAVELGEILDRRVDLNQDRGSSRRERRFFNNYWDDRHRSSPDLAFGWVRISDDTIGDMARLVTQRAKTELRLSEVLSDIELPEDLVEVYGAKGANLIKMKTAIDIITEREDPDLNFGVKIPNFQLVSVDLFDRWKRGESIIQGVRDIHKWICENGADKTYFVRSSAVKSEDGEHMGAGIYKSLLLPPGCTAIQLMQAIREVYASTTSPVAVEYQKSIGVIDEQMGLVIQEAGAPKLDQVNHFTLSTMMPHTPQLADYAIEKGSHPLAREEDESRFYHRSLPLDRKGMFLDFGYDQSYGMRTAPRFHVPPDIKQHKEGDSWMAVQAGVLAEKVLGQAVQVEGVSTQHGNTFNLVQARPLPAEWQIPYEFDGFPEEEPWFEGKSVGVYNGVEVTASGGAAHFDDFEDTGVMEEPQGHILSVWESSYAMSGSADRMIIPALQALSPEVRRRIICLIKEPPTNDSASGYGHLETLFAEMGVGVIFYKPNRMNARPFVKGQKATVYSNGYKARVYSSEDDPRYQVYLNPPEDEDDYRYERAL